ncbi:MAG: cation transporter [Leptospiraceae bacterium]|nr:cation transporter [Leptospiraceae bacterium]
MTFKEYKIPEMSCMHCVKTIQSVAKKISGIQSMEVSLEKKNLRIQFDSSFNEEKLREALQEEGYSLE